MTAILEIPEVRQRVSRLSVAEYHQLGEFNENGRRTELIRGIVIEKMSRSPLHASIVNRLFKMLSLRLPESYVARKEDPLTFRDSEPEPDISVMIGNDEDFAHAHPTTAELVVEVAVSSVALDRANVSLFAEAGVKEYWIVLARQRAVEVYRGLGAEGYAECVTISAPDVLECLAVPAVRVDLGALFA